MPTPGKHTTPHTHIESDTHPPKQTKTQLEHLRPPKQKLCDFSKTKLDKDNPSPILSPSSKDGYENCANTDIGLRKFKKNKMSTPPQKLPVPARLEYRFVPFLVG
mmetsp:Transcript_12679/g.12770  ORF Transcript_12679/g.12770 Transcript_12679/m.12770 type:complete len:105 (-) Transcript_12679:216-530(-)